MPRRTFSPPPACHPADRASLRPHSCWSPEAPRRARVSGTACSRGAHSRGCFLADITGRSPRLPESLPARAARVPGAPGRTRRCGPAEPQSVAPHGGMPGASGRVGRCGARAAAEASARASCFFGPGLACLASAETTRGGPRMTKRGPARRLPPVISDRAWTAPVRVRRWAWARGYCPHKELECWRRARSRPS